MGAERSEIIPEYLKAVAKLRGKIDPVRDLARIQLKSVEERPHLKRNTDALGTNILGAVYLSPDANQVSAGRILGRPPSGISKQRIDQIKRKTLTDLWHLSPAKLKKKYPLKKLMERGPYRLGRKSRIAMELTKQGKSAWEIRNALDTDSAGLQGVRATLRKREVEIGYLTGKGKAFSEKISGAKSNRETQGLLNEVGLGLFGYIRNDVPGALTSVSKLATEAGYHGGSKRVIKFVEALKRRKVPVGEYAFVVRSGKNKGLEQHYHFIATKDVEKAKKALRKIRGLDKFKGNPVSVICGPEPDRLPTLWEMMKHKGLVAVRPSFNRNGVNVRNMYQDNRFGDAKTFTEDCPVTVFRCKSGYYCREEDVDKLERYIKEKLSGPRRKT